MGLKNGIKGGEVFRGVLLAHFILLLHVFIIAALGVFVLILGGLARHLLWFFILGALGVMISAYFIYRRMKTRGRQVIKDAEQIPLLGQREVQIRILGGLVSLTLKPTKDIPELELTAPESSLLLEHTDPQHPLELSQLTHLLKKRIITEDEYQQAKTRLLNLQNDKSMRPR